jgi:hypothetical protein
VPSASRAEHAADAELAGQGANQRRIGSEERICADQLMVTGKLASPARRTDKRTVHRSARPLAKLGFGPDSGIEDADDDTLARLGRAAK